MRRFRFHLGTLVILILIVGGGFAALRESNDLWHSGLFTLTLGVLLISVLLAVHRREAKRAFWIGFALFGWGYLALSLVSSIESKLLTRKALTYLDSKLPRSPVLITGQAWGDVPTNSTGQAWGDLQSSQTDQTVTVPSRSYLIRNEPLTAYYKWLLKGGSSTTENFVRIANSLLTLFMAWFGGQLSRDLYEKNRQRIRDRSRHQYRP